MGRLNEPNPSLWIETTPEAAAQPLSGDVSVDVAVIGAGIAGLCTAMLLSLEGARVAVLDSGRIASGATGYTTAKITALHGLKYAEMLKRLGEDRALAYGQANVAAIERFAALIEEHGIECDFRRMAAYTYTEHETHVSMIEAEVRACEKLGIPARFTTETSLPYPVRGAVVLEDQALFHPRKFALAAAEVIKACGGQIFEETRATDVTEPTGLCLVETERGKVHAKQVVIATHLPFPARGEFYAKTEPSRSYAMAIATKDVPDGMYLNAESPVRSIRPHFLGKDTYLLIGGEGHRVGMEDDTRQRYETLEAWGREHFGFKKVAYRWSAQDFMPVDGVPFIGPIDYDTDRIFVATGFGKWGMTNGMVAAMLLTDRIAGRHNDWALTFDSTRDPLGEPSDAESTLRTVRSVNQVAKGQAAILDRKSGKVAVYRGTGGALHAVAAECTHMGCVVGWNAAERSWDCPCHGSRFDIDGKVIQAPATQDLEQIDVTPRRASAADAA